MTLLLALEVAAAIVFNGVLLVFLLLIGLATRRMLNLNEANRRIVMAHLDAHKARMDALEAQIAELARKR